MGLNKEMDTVFQALSDATRREILRRVAQSSSAGLSAGEIAKPFLDTMSLPAVSKHLKVLRNAGILEDRRVGKSKVYSLRPKPLAQAEKHLSELRVFWEKQLDGLADYFEKGR